MKYGVLFSVVAVLIAIASWMHGGWFFLGIWPALSFALVAGAYLGLGPGVFGKRPNGKLAFASRLLLLPYLAFLEAVWRLIRLTKDEPPYNQLTETIYIGRRLLSKELPAEINHVLDLTSEFDRTASTPLAAYHSFPTLDATAPPLESLRQWVAAAAELPGTIYIHCAEGHGRTGLFSAALLMHTGICKTPDEALQRVQSKRPLVRLNTQQRNALERFHETREQIDC